MIRCCYQVSLTLLASALLVSAATAEQKNGRVVLSPDGWQIARGGEDMRIAVDGEVQAADADGLWFVHALDASDRQLVIHVLQEGRSLSQSVDFEDGIEGACIAQRDQAAADLFVINETGELKHLWAHVDAGDIAVQDVRHLHVNPDTSVCDVTSDWLLVLNEPIGAVKFARHADTDPMMMPAPPEDLEHLQAQRDSAPTAHLDQPTLPSQPFAVLPASGQTAPVLDSGDAADDPAVLSHAGIDWIIGTNKQRALVAYDLSGAVVSRISRGRINNVDAVNLGDGRFLLSGSNRSEMTLDLYVADLKQGTFEFIAAHEVAVDDPYGLCMGRFPDGSAKAFIGGKSGEVQQWAVDVSGDASYELSYQVASQTEGCVYDEMNHALFIGEETLGIWRFDLNADEKTLFTGIEDGLLVADVEGLDICRRGDERWLVASSQGDAAYVIYDLVGPQNPFKFRIGPNIAAGIDGASETDGLACSHGAVEGYPEGILVVQDGRKRAPQGNQNFKWLDWRTIQTLLNSH